MDYDNIKTKGDKRLNIKEKLLKKQVKHGYGEIGRKIMELHFSGGFSKNMKNIFNKSMGLSKKDIKNLKIQKKKIGKKK